MSVVLAQSRAHCESGKLTYWKRNAADRAVQRAAERGELPPLRVYECPVCGHFHPTRKHA